MSAKNVSAFCDLPFTKLRVDPFGNVSMCCYQRGSLGNLLTDDFDRLWTGDLAQEIRMTTAEGRLHPICEGWGGCPYLVTERTARIFCMSRYPLSLELCLPNTHCNIGGTSPTSDTACIMCPRSAPDFQAEPDHAFALADRLRFLMPYLVNLNVQGTAEPFWKDRVFAVLDRLGFKKYNQQCEFNTYTNGTLLNAERRQRLREVCPRSRLYVSIDAATPETYRRIRIYDFFHDVVENVRSLVREKLPTQEVEIANNINLINIDETVAMVELAKDIGVHRVQFNPTHDGGCLRQDLADVRVGLDNYETFAAAQRAIIARASDLGVDVLFIRPLHLNLVRGGDVR
jgi:sulfatase maturation enzyme AslB (radical SAM superfamily)